MFVMPLEADNRELPQLEVTIGYIYLSSQRLGNITVMTSQVLDSSDFVASRQ